eukprot:scaffold7803_cov23-Prasinocladus_malaysianus.AAC.1
MSKARSMTVPASWLVICCRRVSTDTANPDIITGTCCTPGVMNIGLGCGPLGTTTTGCMRGGGCKYIV